MRKIRGILTKELNEYTDIDSMSSSDGYYITSYRDLVEQVAKLSYLNKDYLLFYRGQVRDYRNKAQKSSFYPSIYREYLVQQEIDYRFDLLTTASKMLVDFFKIKKIEGRNELARKKYVQWSILQHYEVVDTPLIDVTQSLRVACSFALHKNETKYAYIYVFGLPFITNRISVNSEHDLVNIRLLSIAPPDALRPYFQEGFLIGTDDITTTYDNKSELDLNNRLIAKFKIPNSDSFWGTDFKIIPSDALYPSGDEIEKICKEITGKVESETPNTDFGSYLKIWVKFVNKLINEAKEHSVPVNTLRDAIYILKKYNILQNDTVSKIEGLRRFRNQVVHSPTDITYDKLEKNIKILSTLMENKLWDS